MKFIRPLFFVVTLALLAGCVSKSIEEKYPLPPLAIAQNSDGDVTIAWKSETGFVYTIFCQAAAADDWKALKNAYRVQGTGGTMTAYDTANPHKPPRRYRILAEKQ